MHYRMLAVDWLRITHGNDWRPMQMATSLARSCLHHLIAQLHGLSVCCLGERLQQIKSPINTFAKLLLCRLYTAGLILELNTTNAEAIA